MSHEYDARYELERKRKQELERKRAADYSEQAIKEISARFEEMKKQEYDSYVPDEMKRLARNIKDISSMIQSDPFAARNLCYQAQHDLNSMAFLVRSAKEEFARQERLRYEEIQRKKAEAKSKLEEAFYSKLSEIKNPALANFGLQDLEEIKTKIQKEEITAEAELVKQIEKATENAEKKAAEWKAQKLEKAKLEIMTNQINEAIKTVENEKFEIEENRTKLINEMSQLKEKLSKDNTTEEITEKLNAIRAEVDNSLINEEVRKETVRAIVKELKSQGFEVETVKPVGEGINSYVLIKAKKPSGKQATCKINLQGKLNYRFDKYEGMTCLKDIEKFNVDLEKIYSVKFSDERVIWENPDRLSRTQSASSDSKMGNM